ncbi:MAG: P-type conjugative transfer ATPase TrbB [Burkholderiales bacterium]|uniref:P-type conjugative transfer ATPase TrbB n=1 Tax=Dokdonella sp. TaxID=2291710 RepID=UPI0027BA5A94|nr:P-type conjugative transfer ATPase TrbB [Dokdonella sp.]MCZ2135879.1 P-type conjugative transfer ATPase TrbB [Burkholderiales bacterium]
MANDAVTSLQAEQDRRIAEKLRRELGREICAHLEAPNVIEIMLNPDGRLWVERLGEGMEIFGQMTPHQAESITTTVASVYRTTITRENPILECELPFDGSRFEALIAPVVLGPTFAIRKKASQVFTLGDYAARGMFRPGSHRSTPTAAKDAWTAQANPELLVKAAIAAKANILVVGGTGSGKTTFANALLQAIAEHHPHDRVVGIEDTPELQYPVENYVSLRTSQTVDMPRLLRATMRLRPDRIVIGEVRGGEAFSLLKAWNSGHPGGFGTIHADSAEEGLEKLTQYVYEAPEARPLPSEIVGRTIAAAVGLVVFIEKIGAAPGRAVTQICRVRGYQPGRGYELAPLCVA